MYEEEGVPQIQLRHPENERGNEATPKQVEGALHAIQIQLQSKHSTKALYSHQIRHNKQIIKELKTKIEDANGILKEKERRRSSSIEH